MTEFGNTSTTLYFGPWYRKSPFFEKTLEAGCKAYDIYNHMYLPGYYDDPVKEYWHLLEQVTLWDVSVERIVEITGSDAHRFTNMLTCRDLDKCAVGQGKYALIMAEDGGIVNDPVLLRLEENRYWLALADSDAGLYARGVAVNSGLDVRVDEPDVYPVQVQGPKSKDVLRDLFGDGVLEIKYYWTMQTRLDDIPEGLVTVVGPNGEGKTNLLEGIAFLFMLESPRASSCRRICRGPMMNVWTAVSTTATPTTSIFVENTWK